MFNYFSGTGSVTTAVDPELMRDLVELGFIETYHWTPDYIKTLPYKWIQKHNLIKKIRTMALDDKAMLARLKSQTQTPRLKPGQKTYREI